MSNRRKKGRKGNPLFIATIPRELLDEFDSRANISMGMVPTPESFLKAGVVDHEEYCDWLDEQALERARGRGCTCNPKITTVHVVHGVRGNVLDEGSLPVMRTTFHHEAFCPLRS